MAISIQANTHEAQGVNSTGRLRSIFIGPAGIRSGWSALLFIVLYIVLSALLSSLLGKFVSLDLHGAIPPLLAFAQESCEMLAVAIATIVMAWIERRSVLSFGHSDKRWWLRLLIGIFCGLAALSTLVLVLWSAHVLAFDGLSLRGLAAVKYAFAWAVIFLLVGFFEESLLRGYLQTTLARGIGFWWAAMLLSIGFGLWHVSNGGESFIGLGVVAIGGFVFCMSLWLTKSLYWAIGFHAGWDWGQSFLYGTADSGLHTEGHLFASHPVGNPMWSGGATGPEGSLFMLPLLLVVAACMVLLWARRTESVA